MKNIKFIVKMLLLCVCAIPVIGDAQTFNAKNPPASPSGPVRGIYGGVQSFTTQIGNICAVVTGTVTPVTSGKVDTLVNADSGYVQFTFPHKVDMLFDLTVNKISGTVAGVAYLQGSLDNVNWHNINGDSTFVTGSIGWQATIANTAGTAHYQWFLPENRGITYPFYQVFVKATGTATESYGGTSNFKY